MITSVTTAVPGVSHRRSAGFAALAVALFAAGALLDLEPGAPVVPLLVVVALAAAAQSTLNGSPVLGLALSVAPALGAWLLTFGPARLFSGAGATTLRIGLAATLLFGVVGHLAGAQFAARDPERYPQQSTHTQLLFAVPLLVLAVGLLLVGRL
jgi:ABC-type spermidine/putrescine transport system permease subunit II